MAVFSFFDAMSHPDTRLTGHLEGVAQIILQHIDRMRVPFDGFKAIAVICGLTHDLGKATREFQEYLNASPAQKTNLDRSLTNHSHLSSILTMVVTDQVLSKMHFTDDKRRLWDVVAAVVVARHHGNLPNIKDFLYTYSVELKKPQYNIKARLDLPNIEKWLIDSLNRHLGLYLQSLNFSNYQSEWENNIDDLLWDWDDIIQSPDAKDLYAHVSLLYSLLIGADKMDAALKTEPPIPAKLKPEMVSLYKSRHFGNSQEGINRLRNQAAIKVVQRFNDAVSNGKRLFTLTAPTGIGKTLMAMDIGMEYANRCDVPLIYCLPFTSIIDQTFDVATAVLENAGLPANNQALLLKHHYLAPVRYTGYTEDLDPDQQEILVEAWNSRIVITTFVQLFDTLFSGRNRAMKKLMQIPGTMVILDEVQGIPRRFWQLVRGTIRAFAREYGTRFLLMTATQPRILGRDEPDTVELLEDYPTYFQRLSRVDLHVHLQDTVTIAELAEQIQNDVSDGKKRVIAIVNTIKDSIELYHTVKGGLNELSVPIIYLSSNLIPLDRLDRIKELHEKDKWVLITTQVVEAGVDISAQVVHRDLAPMDSIVQAAGRCNRNDEIGKGQVHVWRVQREDSTKESSRWVYDTILLESSLDVLTKEAPIFSDHRFPELVEKYFEFIDKRGSEAGQDGRNALDILRRLEFQELGKRANLIPHTITNQYFVIRSNDTHARDLWDIYQDIQKEPDFKSRHQRFMEIKGDFFQRVISVREQGSIIKDIQLLEQETQYGAGGYDPITGYVRSKDAEGGTTIL